jgi:excisionase family DNA binding protein
MNHLPNGPGAAPLLVDRRETARLLGVSANTISNIQRRGELVPVRIGSRVLFDRRDVIAFIDARKGVR